MDGAPWATRTDPVERLRVVGADGLPAGTVLVPGLPWLLRWDAKRLTTAGVSAALTTLTGAEALRCTSRGVVADISDHRTGANATIFRMNPGSAAMSRGHTPIVNEVTSETM